MDLLNNLKVRWDDANAPFLISAHHTVSLNDVLAADQFDLSIIQGGDVVALIGDYNPRDISILLRLIDRKAIVVPLTAETKEQHQYFFEAALVDFVIVGGEVSKRLHNEKNALIEELRHKVHPGLVLFSTGTTGRPKAILHDLKYFMTRFESPRPTLKTLNFLLFDHIGGLNTLFHTLFNKGTVVAPLSRSVESVLTMCRTHQVELLPATPTFLRLLLLSGVCAQDIPATLKIITYGTERMDQPTLDALCELCPKIDFRQTFGMSELGILRVKSEARNSLFMRIGGEGVETRVDRGVLYIRSQSRMIGYLNADNPFDNDGWYNTKDMVEVKGDFIKVVGRVSEVINVGGLKFMASEVERVALQAPGVELATAKGVDNPITGQHVELVVQINSKANFPAGEIRAHFESRLPSHMIPRRIHVDKINVGHRFKKT